MTTRRQFKKIAEMQIKMKTAYCCICQKPILKISDYNLEHKIPVHRGGERDNPENWGIAHKKCNSEKGSLTMDEYRLWLALERKRHGNEK